MDPHIGVGDYGLLTPKLLSNTRQHRFFRLFVGVACLCVFGLLLVATRDEGFPAGYAINDPLAVSRLPPFSKEKLSGQNKKELAWQEIFRDFYVYSVYYATRVDPFQVAITEFLFHVVSMLRIEME